MSNWAPSRDRASLSHTNATMGAFTNGTFNGLGTTSPEDGGVRELWDRYHEARVAGIRKDALLEETISRYEHLLRQYNELSGRYQGGQKDLVAEKQKQLQHMQDVMNRGAFILVLLDGDGMIFNNLILQDGEKGGRQAAWLLKDSIKKWALQFEPELPSDYRIVVRVYANVSGLADVLVRAGIVKHASTFEDFTRGFTRSDNLFDFVDVGSGKDRADAKIIDGLKLTLLDYHCRQILFGCSHDNGYARTLENYANDGQAKARVTLLEGVPFEKELLELPFRTVGFPGVFRDMKINLGNTFDFITGPVTRNRENSILNASSGIFTPRTTTPASTYTPGGGIPELDGQLPVRANILRTDSVASSMTNLSISNTSQTAKPANSWAKLAITAADLPQTNTAPPREQVPVARHNKKGQRIDPPIPVVEESELYRVKKIKMCNQHYLGKDGCGRPSGKCGHRHDYRPSASEMKTLVRVSRETPCRNGVGCDEPACIYGHRCPFAVATEGTMRGIGCLMGTDCRFPIEMHGITDSTAVKFTKIT